MLRCLLIGMLAVFSLGQLCWAEEPNNPLDALEKKLQGEWRGQGPCDGVLTLQAGGNYEWKAFGPAGDHLKGKWKLSWNALPPTLMLHEAEPADDVDPDTAWKVKELNEKSLVIQFIAKPPAAKSSAMVFRREQKPE